MGSNTILDIPSVIRINSYCICVQEHIQEIMIYSYIFWIIAAALNSCMDNIRDHWYKSWFKTLNNPKYFNPDLSYLNKYKNRDVSQGLIKWWIFDKPIFLTDFWHLCKSLMITFICLSIVLFNEEVFQVPIVYVFLAYGFSWNFVFNLFYNHILIKQQ